MTAEFEADGLRGRSVGDMLRRWRAQRRLSQLDLALSAEVSSRHLSFVESGRSNPSRALLERLAQELDVPLRARNQLLVAAGYAPHYSEAPLSAPELAAARAAVAAVLEAHAPFPALAVDRHWTLLHANAGVEPLLRDVRPDLLAGPVNVLRITLHPAGLAPGIENLSEWRRHLLDRLRREAEGTGDPGLTALLEELHAYPAPLSDPAVMAMRENGVAVPLVLRATGDRPRLSLLSTTTVFGTATSVTLSELALEALYPTDDVTREFFQSVRPVAAVAH